MSDEILNKMSLDMAEAVSFNVDTADNYIKENNIDIEKYINRGFDQLNPKNVSQPKQKQELSKSKSFFRRVVLAAKIAHECHNEWTFGSVKFQKMVYLCEQVSQMNFCTNYSKQAAGPMDNKFIHSVKPQFEKQGWFKVEKVKTGKYEKVQFTPLESVEGYQKYYSSYYQEVDTEIQFLIDTFRKKKTDEVELVATLYDCILEAKKEKSIISDELLIKKVYAWNKSKKKFSKNQIVSGLRWMEEKGIYPNQ